jgi:small neutral amino acid transporter SnatA (MarC family)
MFAGATNKKKTRDCSRRSLTDREFDFAATPVAGGRLCRGAGVFLFQIDIHQFAFAGGLLLVVIGIRGIVASPDQRKQFATNEDQRHMDQVRLAVAPIASPLLVGPGSNVNVMLIANQQGRLFALGACVVAFVGVMLIPNYAHVLY